MYKKKYKKGEPITSLDELAKQKFVFIHITSQVSHQLYITQINRNILDTTAKLINQTMKMIFLSFECLLDINFFEWSSLED